MPLITIAIPHFFRMFFPPTAKAELLQARYQSLVGDIPVALFTAMSAAMIQIIVLKDKIDWKFSVLLPSFRMLIGLALLVYWYRHRLEQPSAQTIRKRLELASLIMVVAGVATFIRSLYLFQLADDLGRYFLIFHTTIYGFCFAFILSKIGVAAYLYNLTLISCAIVCMFLGHMQHAWPMTTLILIFEAAMLLAMRTSNRVFDQLVYATHDSNLLLEQNRQLANQDALTHLPNRRHFFLNVEDQLAQANTQLTPFTVGIVDLDNFKPVNDNHGHHIGDLVLIEVGNRLSRFRPAEIQFYRIGGDEFAFLLVSADPQQLRAIGDEILQVISAPIVLEQLTLRISASIGTCICQHTHDNAKSLYEAADRALYHVKAHGRGNQALFSDLHQRLQEASQTPPAAFA